MGEGKQTFVVGQTFWFRPNDSRRDKHGYRVSVTKVGRRWVQLTGGMRFDQTSANWRLVDGGQYSSPGRLWESWTHCRDAINVTVIFRRIRDQSPVGSYGCDKISVENALRAAELLGVQIDEESLLK